MMFTPEAPRGIGYVCSGCDAHDIGDEEFHAPESGDTVEVPVGAQWLPARVTSAARLGPRPPFGATEDWATCLFNFELVGADHIGGCAWVVTEEHAKGYGVAWRWPR